MMFKVTDINTTTKMIMVDLINDTFELTVGKIGKTIIQGRTLNDSDLRGKRFDCPYVGSQDLTPIITFVLEFDLYLVTYVKTFECFHDTPWFD
jgi:hypothetical protein